MKSEKSFYILLSAFCLAPFMTGAFHEWQSAALSLMLIAALVLRAKEKGGIDIQASPLTLAAVMLPACFLVSAFYAADRGMAAVGMIKFIPAALFCVLISQYDREERQKLLAAVPYCGAVMTAVTAVIFFIPSVSGPVSVNGRLAGTFQYPNAFAVYLLAGIIIQLYGRKLTIKSAVISAVLTAGIILSGCRAVMLLLAAFIIICAAGKKGGKVAVIIFLAAAAAAAAVIVSALISGGAILSLLTAVSHRSSTVIGRILYDIDAIPVILKNPLGLGYLGYFFRQGGFQTGVYSVMHAHNDIFQILLDVGWLPFAVCVWAAVSSLKRADGVRRLLTAFILAHAAVDFDLQFISIDFILIAAMTYDAGKKYRLTPKRAAAGLTVAGALSAWLGAASLTYYFRAYDAAAAIYPAYTTAYIARLAGEGDEERKADAETIVSLCDSYAPAYRVLAREAFSDGDITGMIKYAEAGISAARYDIDGYLEYIDMLYIAAEMYRQAGDADSEAFCLERLSGIPAALEKVKQNTSPLAWMITDKPELDLPEEYISKIKTAGGIG